MMVITVMIVIIIVTIIIIMKIIIVIIITVIIHHSMLYLLRIEFHNFFYLWYFRSNITGYWFKKFTWLDVLFLFFTYFFTDFITQYYFFKIKKFIQVSLIYFIRNSC